LAVFSYWKDDDFVARFVPRTWSIAVIVSATGKQRQRAQGVRLTLFGQAEDQPDRETLRWPLEPWHMHFPVLHMTLFDVKPTEGRAAPEPYPPLKLGDPRLLYVRGNTSA
jgi:hypothetical protein